ncbi:MAG TPA: hemerythrin domain-containing protein [Azospirillaceae bacterium]|nr:hemerythrin domain-containing protein [Azospirillaceae bacterium]
MILQMIEEDHGAVRDLIGVIGNSEMQAFAARREAFARLARLWRRHGAMMDAAVHPLMLDSAEGADTVSEALQLQRQAEQLAQDLSDRQRDPSEPWRDGLSRLRELLDRQCALEDVAFVGRIPALPPQRVADMTRVAGDVRAAHAARAA